MDVDDEFLTLRGGASAYRRRACRCAVAPVAPRESIGCTCPKCAARCRKCIGFGYAEPPVRRFTRILIAVRAQIRRRVRQCGRDPGYVRLPPEDIKVLRSKLAADGEEHWSAKWVDLGPPLRILDVIVVEDRRRDE